jgi:hypothetical protein
VGDVYEAKAKAVEEVLSLILGPESKSGLARCASIDISAFRGLSGDAQRELVCHVAGATMDEESIAALKDRIAALDVSAEDARGRPVSLTVGEEIAATAAAWVAKDGLAAAKSAGAEKRNAAQRSKQAADKARKRLAELAFEDVPAGHLEEVKSELQAAQERAARAREELSARSATQREHARLAAAVKEASAAVSQATTRRAELQGGSSPEAAARDLSAAENSLATAQAADTEALTALRTTDNEARRLSAAIEELRKSGQCPTCRISGKTIEAALGALETDSRIAIRRVERFEQRYGQTTAALSEARSAVATARKIERETREREAERKRLLDQIEREKSALAKHEAALAGLPAVQGVEDLEAERDAAAADAKRLSDESERLTRAQENQRQRAQNEQDLSDALAARALWTAVLAELSRTEAELAAAAYGRVEALADELVRPAYDGAARFQFRPPHQKKGDEGADDPPPWGWGLAFATADRELWKPYSALSASEKTVCGLSLHYAIVCLAGRAFRPFVLEGLEVIGTGRAVALLGALAAAHAAARISCLLAEWKTDETTQRDDLRAACDAKGLCVLDLTDVRPGDGASVSIDHSLPVAAPAIAVAPEHRGAADAGDPRWDRRPVACRSTNQRIQIAAHRARGCGCNAELLDASAVALKPAAADDESLEWARELLAAYAYDTHMEAQAKDRGAPDERAMAESRQAAAAAERCKAEQKRRAAGAATPTLGGELRRLEKAS